MLAAQNVFRGSIGIAVLAALLLLVQRPRSLPAQMALRVVGASLLGAASTVAVVAIAASRHASRGSMPVPDLKAAADVLPWLWAPASDWTGAATQVIRADSWGYSERLAVEIGSPPNLPSVRKVLHARSEMAAGWPLRCVRYRRDNPSCWQLDVSAHYNDDLTADRGAYTQVSNGARRFTVTPRTPIYAGLLADWAVWSPVWFSLLQIADRQRRRRAISRSTAVRERGGLVPS